MYDEKQWAIVPRSIADYFGADKKFTVQKLKYPALPRVCYKITHKHMNRMKQECVKILDHYAKSIYLTNS
ncbi:MAG TPA: hypothetical protein VEG39_06175 [Clostridia bacterium]|nr:hypothetical protein [Clostridia bacterium]